MSKKTSRRQERELAFQALYSLEFAPKVDAAGLARSFAETPLPGDVAASVESPAEGFAWELVKGVWERQEELDEVIVKFSQNWRIPRIARTDLTVLRLGLYEMLHRPDVPVKVAINEAVELAKQFGDDSSPGFVNGILDAAAKALEHGQIGVHKGR
jgi:N utilization substance protein B